MTLRIDHVAGAAFVAFGVAIIALSGDLPFGALSMPGAGFMPVLVATLTILLGAALFLRAGESAPFADIHWGDLKHAAPVVAITAGATAFYTTLGFILTMALMMIALIVIVERRNVFRAAVYSVGVVVVTFVTFEYLLKTPLPALEF